MAIRYNDEHRKTLREIINRNDVRHEIENVRFALSHNHDVAFNETKLTAIYHEYKWALTDNGKLEPIPADLREYIDYIDADKQPEREIKPNA